MEKNFKLIRSPFFALLLVGTLSTGCQDDGFYFAEVDSSLSTDSPTGNNSDPNGEVGKPGETQPPTSNESMSDFFSQNQAERADKFDIVWVVDSSGSMGNEQDALARNFDLFIKDFINRNLDFRIGITTTDDGENGEFRNGNLQLTSDVAASNPNRFINDFKNLINVGTGGSGREKGLNGALKSLSNNGNFFRDDAYLIFIVVSDEEDQSSLSVQQYIDSMRSYKANDNLVQVYSIVNTTGPVYEGDSRGETRGLRYMEASNATGGTIANINDDFHNILTQMGETIVNLLGTFNLSRTPVVETLEVLVNGNPASGWVYNSNSNSIVFNENNLPVEGSSIVVNYEVSASP